MSRCALSTVSEQKIKPGQNPIFWYRTRRNQTEERRVEESRWNRGIPCTDIIHTAQIQLSTQIPIPEKERVERTEERKNSPFHHRRLPSGSYPGYLWSPSRTPLPHSYRILHLLRQIVDLLLWPIIPLRRLELGVDEVLILLWVDLLLRVRQNIDRLYFQQGCR